MNKKRYFINNLSDEDYEFDSEFHNLLDSSKYHKLTEFDNQNSSDDSKLLENNERHTNKHKSGVYLIMFRIIKDKDKKKLIYNYIYYHPKLVRSIFQYFIYRNNYSNIITRDIGNYTVYLDDSFVGTDIHVANKDTPNHLKFNDYDVIHDISNMHKHSNNFFSLINLISKINYCDNLDELSKLVDLLYTTTYFELVRKIFGKLVSYEKLEARWESQGDIIMPLDEIDTTLINKSLFMIRDKDNFINKLNILGFDDLNEGPQRWRGQVNSMSSFLSKLDLDIRNSLFNHNRFHINNNTIDRSLELPRNKFSFTNIHMNIGNVRWYSTSRHYKNISTPINRNDLLDNNFITLKNIIDKYNNVGSEKLQRDIEMFLYNQEKMFFENSDSITKIIYGDKTYDFILQERDKIIKLIDNTDFTKNINILQYNSEYQYLFKLIICSLGSKEVAELTLGLFMIIVSNESAYNKKHDEHLPGYPTLRAFDMLGKRLAHNYINNEYKKYIKINDDNITYSLYKEKFGEIYNDFEKDNVYASIGGYFTWLLVYINLLYEAVDSKPGSTVEKTRYLRVSNDVRKTLLDNNYKSLHLPTKLPMVCKPKDYVYSKDGNKLGGYLLNDEYYSRDVFIDKIGYKNKTTLSEKNLVIDLVNGISSTPYKINKDTLSFIYQQGYKHDILIDTDDEKYNRYLSNPYKSLNKDLRNEYRSLNSKIIMERNILNIAELYSNFDSIYFPVRLDHRTRMYCITDYFDYQKSDLAKGLISFSIPGVINKWDNTAIEYFKAFGANMYGEGLDKKSLKYRVNWVDSNSEEILNFEYNDIVSKAENKTCFISFCFEYKRYIEFINNIDAVSFNTYLPIQLDASCNGQQHQALLTNERELFDVLNLTPASFHDNPKDYYSFVIIEVDSIIMNKINEFSKKDRTPEEDLKYNSYLKLEQLSLVRDIVKKTIMTNNYNAAVPTLVKNICKKLNKEGTNRNPLYYYEGSDIRLTFGDITGYVMLMKDAIAKAGPKIKQFSDYLNDIVGICTALKLPVPWKLPSGAEISESYFVKKKASLKGFTFIKHRYIFTKFDRSNFDLGKQKRSMMPNLIHSLDASTIALLYSEFSKIGSLYTVHDCFAVTANNVQSLIDKIKWVYINMYSNYDYIKQFDQYIKYHIAETCGSNVYRINDHFVYPPNSDRIAFPNINKIFDFQNETQNLEILKNASYIII